MANQFRAPLYFQTLRRIYNQVDQPPNLAANFFPTVPPFKNEAYLLERVEARKYAQDFQWTGTTTRGIPTQPVTNLQFRPPSYVLYVPRYYRQVEQTSSSTIGLLSTGAALPPFVPPQFPDAPRRIEREFQVLEALSYLPGPVIAPYIPADLPTPMRARQNPQDFFFASTGIGPTKPFKQDDWPLHLPRRVFHQDFWWLGFTTRGIPTGVATPFNFDDWPPALPRKFTFHDIPPNTTLKGLPQPFPFRETDWVVPVRVRDFPGESYDSPRILLITPVATPFAQSDWPLPSTRHPATPFGDFYFEAWNTIQRPTIPTGHIVMPNLIGMNFYEAAEILEEVGIYVPDQNYFAETSTITVIWRKSREFRGGVVIAQSIPAGTLVAARAPLTLTLASFPFSSLIDLPPDWKQVH